MALADESSPEYSALLQCKHQILVSAAAAASTDGALDVQPAGRLEHERLQEEVDRASEAQRDTLYLRGASLLDMEKKLQKNFTIPTKGKR